MANWCSNTVVFEGSPEAIGQVQQLFSKMAENEKREGCGQLPDFVPTDNGGYFFELYWDFDNEGIFQYETKWSPNTEVLQQIADRYSVDFIHDYEELGCLIYGRATYTNGLLHDIWLDGGDFDAFEADGEMEAYQFEGNKYDCEYEVLEILLERKIAAGNALKTE